MLSDYFVECVRMTKLEQPDSETGILQNVYVIGNSVKCGISTNNSTEAQIACQNGLKTLYTVVSLKDEEFRQDDLITTPTGKLLRITSNSADMATPSPAMGQYWQCTAEEVDP